MDSLSLSEDQFTNYLIVHSGYTFEGIHPVALVSPISVRLPARASAYMGPRRPEGWGVPSTGTSGHRTNSVYKRYNIVDDQRETVQQVHDYQKREKEERKAVPIRRAGLNSDNFRKKGRKRARKRT